MAYGAEHDRIRAILPDGFTSIRPVLRINAEIRDKKFGYVEFNTAVSRGGDNGWINIGFWNDVVFERSGGTVTFKTDFLEISFSATGVEGGCPSEKDNTGCWFADETVKKKPVDIIAAKKEFCDCEFKWNFADMGAHGKSIGKTLPAYPSEVRTIYDKLDFTVENAAVIPCMQVLGSYKVVFERE